MRNEEIQRVRRGLRLTQTEFAQLLGVAPITISCWERPTDKKRPGPWHVAILEAGRLAVDQPGDLEVDLAEVLAASGVARALYRLLLAAFDPL